MAGKSVIVDQPIVAAVTSSSSSGKELQNEIDRLANSLSNLNPNAKKFNRVVTHKLSADAPSFDYHKINGDGSSGSCSSTHTRNGVRKDESKIRRTIYICNLPVDVTEWDLAMYFKLCGIIKECRVCGNINSPLRFAFIEFSNEIAARLALSLSGKPMLGYPNDACLKIVPSKTAILPVSTSFLPMSNQEMERAYRTIYCTNIDKKVPDTKFIDFFEQFCGEVTEFRILYYPKHSTCIAFVEFSQWEAAISALRYSGTLFGDLPIRINPSKTAVKDASSHRG